MPVGKSGRIVIEIDPDVKQELYKSLGKESSSLRSWFLDNVSKYLARDSGPQTNTSDFDSSENKETMA